MLLRVVMAAVAIQCVTAFLPSNELASRAILGTHRPWSGRASAAAPDPSPEQREADAKAKAEALARLREEAANPFRSLRFFVYGSSAFSAGIGGMSSLAQLAGTLGGAKYALPLDQVVQNLAINFGVVAAMGTLWKLDSDSQQEERERISTLFDKRNQVKKTKIPSSVLKASEKQFGNLEVEVVVGEDAKRTVPIKDLQANANQHVVVLAGNDEMISDALLSAELMGTSFARADILVVPVEQAADANAATKGFGKQKDPLGFVAKPAADALPAWKAFLDNEIANAEKQADDPKTIREQGIVLVLRNDGKVVRRGLGLPDWSMIKADLQPTTSQDAGK